MSSTEQFLRELYVPAMHDLVAAEMAERRRADEEWLASLSPTERRAELIRRRIARCEERLRAAVDFSRCNCDCHDW